MDFKVILTNQLVAGAGVSLLIAILSLILARKKLMAWGLAISQWLNKRIGVKATQWIESKLQELLDGMESDNGVKK